MISPGAILIKKGTLLPAPLELRNDSTGWASVAHNGDLLQLEKALAATGWTFFYMAGAIRRAAFGLRHPTAMNAALRRVVADVESQRCNCLEIDDIETHSFLGIPYARV